MFLCVYLYLRSIIRGVLSCVFGLVFCFVFSNKKKCQQSRQLHNNNNNNNNKNIIIIIIITTTKMFQIARLKDSAVTIKPQHLDKEPLTAIVAELEELYVDKVITDLGLVVTLYEVNSIKGGIIYAGDGAAHYEVEFRMVVFSPFVNEILVGKVYSLTDENGIRVSLGFFDDLIVLPNKSGMDLEKTKWDDKEKIWYIEEESVEFLAESNNEGNREEIGAMVKKFIEPGQQIRVRVTQVTYPEEPKTKQELQKRKLEDGGQREGKFAPMIVRCSIGELDALGPVDENEGEDDEDELEEDDDE